jgi:hypothetical protein
VYKMTVLYIIKNEEFITIKNILITQDKLMYLCKVGDCLNTATLPVLENNFQVLASTLRGSENNLENLENSLSRIQVELENNIFIAFEEE